GVGEGPARRQRASGREPAVVLRVRLLVGEVLGEEVRPRRDVGEARRHAQRDGRDDTGGRNGERASLEQGKQHQRGDDGKRRRTAQRERQRGQDRGGEKEDERTPPPAPGGGQEQRDGEHVGRPERAEVCRRQAAEDARGRVQRDVLGQPRGPVELREV